jgi:hypothetical protein
MADFAIANYEMDAGGFRPVKVLLSTISTANPNGATEGTGSYVRAGGSKKRYGTVCRQISIARNIGTGGDYDTASVSVTIPIFQKSVWTALAVGSAYTYGGKNDWLVVGKISESTR